MLESTSQLKIWVWKNFYWIPIGFVHLVNLLKQFQSGGYPIFGFMVLISQMHNLALYWYLFCHNFSKKLIEKGAVGSKLLQIESLTKGTLMHNNFDNF